MKQTITEPPSRTPGVLRGCKINLERTIFVSNVAMLASLRLTGRTGEGAQVYERILLIYVGKGVKCLMLMRPQ
jgi:hypothetical protein